jgi:DNA-binding GntR family transcriptional regulator
VLEVAPSSIREVFDDHKDLTDALRGGDAEATAAAITGHVNLVRAALAAFVGSQGSPATDASRPVTADFAR